MEKDKDRLLTKIIKKDNKCWEFTGFLNKEGYGSFWMNDFMRSIGAHRASWILHNGPIDSSGICVCHKCDNPKCINPDHLFLGEAKDNMKDKVLKNRQARGVSHKCYLYPELILKGDRNPGSKITDIQVEEIRILYKTTNLTYKDLSIIYKLSEHQIGNIIRRTQRK